MNESSDEPPLSDRIRSWAREKAYESKFNPFGAVDPSSQTLPLANLRSNRDATDHTSTAASRTTKSSEDGNSKTDRGGQDVAADSNPSNPPPPAPPPVDTGEKGEEPAAIASEPKLGVFNRLWIVFKTVLFHSWINVLLAFVPVGIALGALNKAGGEDHHAITPAAVFAVNAIAIIPLAGLLSYATESVAARLGDTLGALLNVSFGNAVELIILYAPRHSIPYY